MTAPLPPDPAAVTDRYGHTEADHEAAGACQRPSMAARVAASRTELPMGSDAGVAFQRGWDAATAAAARSGGAQDDGLRARVARLVEDHEIRMTPNGELFADRLDDILRRALAGSDDTHQDGAR